MPRRSRRLLGLAASPQPLPVKNEADKKDRALQKPPSKLERKYLEQLNSLTNAESTKEPDASKSREVRPFLFLSLPIELRYMVYELNFVGLTIYGHRKEGFCINEEGVNFYYYGPSNRNGYRTTASLLRTCKTIHHEATKWLYAGNFYVIQLPLDIYYRYTGQMGCLLDWLEKIGPTNRSYLRSITFKNKDDVRVWTLTSNNGGGNYRTCSFSVAKLLAGSANLQKLTTLHFYDTSKITNTWARPPSEESKSKNWTHRACMTAEIMYKDFRPMISQAIASGRPLDDILKLLMPDEKSFEWYHLGNRKWADKARWTQEQADEGKAAMAEHMMLLLEKNLAYQRKRGWVQT